MIAGLHFNPRSPHGERRRDAWRYLTAADFNPRSPHGERPGRTAGHSPEKEDFNPRSPHGERHRYTHRRAFPDNISIHAPRTGSDEENPPANDGEEISIHAPRTGSDTPVPGKDSGRSYFNPRSPHGERRAGVREIPPLIYFNPRSPHGERHRVRRHGMQPCNISIHAPRTGSDRFRSDGGSFRGHFNPRSPHGERRLPTVSSIR